MKQSSLKNIDPEHLISSLRSEIGDIIETWTLMRELYLKASSLMTDNIQEDLKNEELNKLNILKIKLNDEIVSKLSEIGYNRKGTVNFHFASSKFKLLKNEVLEFEKFLKENQFRDKRNQHISHKMLAPNFEESRSPHIIKYKTVLKGIAMAMILMKKFDILIYGPHLKDQWLKVRKRRYQYRVQAKIGYILLPYVN